MKILGKFLLMISVMCFSYYLFDHVAGLVWSDQFFLYLVGAIGGLWLGRHVWRDDSLG